MSGFWKWLAIILLILICVLLIWIFFLGGMGWICETFCCQDTVPVAERIEADVHQVQLAPDDNASPTFQLYTWYRTHDGEILSGAFGPTSFTFKPSSNGSFVVGDQGALATVTGFPATGATTASIQVASGMSAIGVDNISLTQWASATAAGATGDYVVKSKYAPNQLPEVALLEESPSGACPGTWSTTPVAFVGAASVGKQAAKPCSIAWFSSHQMLYGNWPAAPGSPILALTPPHAPGAAPDAPLDVPAIVHIAVTGRTAMILSGIALTTTSALVADIVRAATAQAQADIAWANVIFAGNRAGLRIVPRYDTIDVNRLIALGYPDIDAAVGNQVSQCAYPRQHLAGTGTGYYGPDSINIYYLDWIQAYDPLNPDRGDWCPTETPPIIYISYTRHSTTSLAHELGHALGLSHVTYTSINLMDVSTSDGALGVDARSHLTLGQVFLTNVSDNSWLNATKTSMGIPLVPIRSGKHVACPTGCPPPDLDVP